MCSQPTCFSDRSSLRLRREHLLGVGAWGWDEAMSWVTEVWRSVGSTGDGEEDGGEAVAGALLYSCGSVWGIWSGRTMREVAQVTCALARADYLNWGLE